jgi:hypothetical protein
MSEKLKLSQPYPLGDRLTYREAENAFRLYAPSMLPSISMSSASRAGHREQWVRDHIKAVATGEKRPPKKGEWYLSGSTIVAYRALDDLTSPFHIAAIVRIEQVITYIKHEITLDDGPTMGSAINP